MRRLAALLLLVLAGPAHAAEPVDNSLRDLALGYALADHALATGSADLMLQAFAILQPLDGSSLRRSDEGQERVLGAAALIGRLQDHARGDPALAARLQQQMARADKGLPTGPLRTQRAIAPQTIWTVELSARGGEALHVLARASLPESIELVVQDGTGQDMCRRRPSPASTLSCNFTPERGADYQVRLINRVRAPVTVVLYTN